ncbi:type II secretion system F family protein [Pseudomonas fontis]|uniref:Type II secretion system F family protein n=1 Tax=Pseudomonas fontis TaxID=2942633 RepID=A0ABT5NUM6_9PSED|nr:type II secretion system F family protein [Pseudomonas fontis]MDD0974264.1 type II secretion system F family protein [Pseudomonas fontis]MDD0991885.1 type II secretion system F family protein [Pseudomonas fontis]
MTTKTRTYTWQGIDRTGARVSGHNQGHSPALIKNLLRQRGIRPTQVRTQHNFSLKLPATLSSKDLTQFSRQLATLFQAGIPLLQGFDIIAEGCNNPALQTLVNALKTDINAGNSLADALRKHPRHFDALYCNLIAVGELTGRLDTLLDELATYQEKREALRARMKKAMIYPMLVLMVGFGVAALLLLKVVPQFESLFAGFGAQLPAFTQAVIHLADWLGNHLLLMLGMTVGTVLAARQAYQKRPAFRLWALQHAMQLPILGALLQHAAMARFARTLSTAFAAGVPLLEALGPVASASGNALYEQAIQRLRQALASGSSLSAAMRANPLFPPLSVQMCGIGETSGTLDDMLKRIAGHHEQAIDHLLDKLASLLEPLIVLILGLMVGSLVIAMYLPIFKLGDVI